VNLQKIQQLFFREWGTESRNCFYGIGYDYLSEMAQHSTKPVMSLQDDIYHPFQGLADLMTIYEQFGKNLKGLKVTVSWDTFKTFIRSANAGITFSAFWN